MVRANMKQIDRSIVVPPEHRLGGAHGPGHLRQEMEPGPDDRQAPPLHRLRPLRPHARLPDQQPHLSPVQERHQAVREEGQGLDPEVLLDAGRFLLPREGRRAVARIPRRHRCSLRREGTGRETPRCCCILVDPPRGRVARQEQRETPVEKGNGVSSGPVRGGAIYGECRSKLAQEEISELRHLYCPEKKN
uniref:UBC9 n=1 Tax=Arundo donax TaxID=35708 RepID=A0A0A9EZR6_ARUDO